MRTRYIGEVLAMLLVGGAATALIHVDSHGILSCLPLLVGLFAIRKGATWAVFAVMAGSAGLAALSITGLGPRLLLVGAAAAAVPAALVVPFSWRRDRLATAVLSVLALVVGIAGALVPSGSQSALLPQPAARDSANAAHRIVVDAHPVSRETAPEPPCAAADVVGIYETNHSVAETLVLDASFGFVLYSDGRSPLRGTFTIEGSEVVLRAESGDHYGRIACVALNGAAPRGVWQTREVAR